MSQAMTDDMSNAFRVAGFALIGTIVVIPAAIPLTAGILELIDTANAQARPPAQRFK